MFESPTFLDCQGALTLRVAALAPTVSSTLHLLAGHARATTVDPDHRVNVPPVRRGIRGVCVVLLKTVVAAMSPWVQIPQPPR
jgi:hypothetical protein